MKRTFWPLVTLVPVLGILLAACGGGGMEGTPSSPSGAAPVKKPNLELKIVGLKSATLKSATRGGNPAYTLNVVSIADKGNPKSAGKHTLLYSKTVGMHDVHEEAKKMARELANAETSESISLALPEGVNTIGVEIAGPQGVVTSEEIAVEASAANPPTVIAGVETLPDEFAPYASGAELNVALYAASPATAPDAQGTDTASNIPDDGSAQAHMFAVNPDTGEMFELGNVRAGHGGTGYVEDYREGGVIGFLASKENNELLVFIRADDGAMTPLANLPEGTTKMTLAQSPEGDTIYILDRGANVVRVYDRMVDGSLQEAGHQATGLNPREIFTMPGSRLLVAANEGDDTLSVFPIRADGGLGAGEVIPAGDGPKSIAHNYDEQFVYVANSDKTVSRFRRGADNRLVLEASIQTPVEFSSIVMDPSGTVMEGIVGQPEGSIGGGAKQAKWSIGGWDPGVTLGSFSSAVTVVATVGIAVASGTVAYYALGQTVGASAIGSFLGWQIATGGYNACATAWSAGNGCFGYSNTPQGIAQSVASSSFLYSYRGRIYRHYKGHRGYTSVCISNCRS